MDLETELSHVKNHPGTFLIISPVSSSQEVVVQNTSGTLEQFLSFFREDLNLIGFYHINKDFTEKFILKIDFTGEKVKEEDFFILESYLDRNTELINEKFDEYLNIKQYTTIDISKIKQQIKDYQTFKNETEEDGVSNYHIISLELKEKLDQMSKFSKRKSLKILGGLDKSSKRKSLKLTQSLEDKSTNNDKSSKRKSLKIFDTLSFMKPKRKSLFEHEGISSEKSLEIISESYTSEKMLNRVSNTSDEIIEFAKQINSVENNLSPKDKKKATSELLKIIDFHEKNPNASPRELNVRKCSVQFILKKTKEMKNFDTFLQQIYSCLVQNDHPFMYLSSEEKKELEMKADETRAWLQQTLDVSYAIVTQRFNEIQKMYDDYLDKSKFRSKTILEVEELRIKSNQISQNLGKENKEIIQQNFIFIDQWIKKNEKFNKSSMTEEFVSKLDEILKLINLGEKKKILEETLKNLKMNIEDEVVLGQFMTKEEKQKLLDLFSKLMIDEDNFDFQKQKFENDIFPILNLPQQKYALEKYCYQLKTLLYKNDSEFLSFLSEKDINVFCETIDSALHWLTLKDSKNVELKKKEMFEIVNPIILKGKTLIQVSRDIENFKKLKTKIEKKNLKDIILTSEDEEFIETNISKMSGSVFQQDLNLKDLEQKINEYDTLISPLIKNAMVRIDLDDLSNDALEYLLFNDSSSKLTKYQRKLIETEVSALLDWIQYQKYPTIEQINEKRSNFEEVYLPLKNRAEEHYKLDLFLTSIKDNMSSNAEWKNLLPKNEKKNLKHLVEDTIDFFNKNEDPSIFDMNKKYLALENIVSPLLIRIERTHHFTDYSNQIKGILASNLSDFISIKQKKMINSLLIESIKWCETFEDFNELDYINIKNKTKRTIDDAIETGRILQELKIYSDSLLNDKNRWEEEQISNDLLVIILQNAKDISVWIEDCGLDSTKTEIIEKKKNLETSVDEILKISNKKLNELQILQNRIEEILNFLPTSDLPKPNQQRIQKIILNTRKWIDENGKTASNQKIIEQRKVFNYLIEDVKNDKTIRTIDIIPVEEVIKPSVKLVNEAIIRRQSSGLPSKLASLIDAPLHKNPDRKMSFFEIRKMSMIEERVSRSEDFLNLKIKAVDDDSDSDIEVHGADNFINDENSRLQKKQLVDSILKFHYLVSEGKPIQNIEEFKKFFIDLKNLVVDASDFQIKEIGIIDDNIKKFLFALNYMEDETDEIAIKSHLSALFKSVGPIFMTTIQQELFKKKLETELEIIHKDLKDYLFVNDREKVLKLYYETSIWANDENQIDINLIHEKEDHLDDMCGNILKNAKLKKKIDDLIIQKLQKLQNSRQIVKIFIQKSLEFIKHFDDSCLNELPDRIEELKKMDQKLGKVEIQDIKEFEYFVLNFEKRSKNEKMKSRKKLNEFLDWIEDEMEISTEVLLEKKNQIEKL
eukprot:gene3108-5278_t